jgi:hypothetical protein
VLSLCSLRKLLPFFVFFSLCDFIQAKDTSILSLPDSGETVYNKLYPKGHKLELSLPSFGFFMNQSYVASSFIKMHVGYYRSEQWGFFLEGFKVLNQDKEERYCIENFYNDFEDKLAVSCPLSSEDKSTHLFDGSLNPRKGANFGPAYPDVREIQYILSGMVEWAPIYGKKLLYMSHVFFFDLFFHLGGAIVLSDHYPESFYLRNGKLARGTVSSKDLSTGGCPSGENIPGVCPGDPDVASLVGKGGRPTPKKEVLPGIVFSIGQKIHFLERWHIRGEIQSLTIFTSGSQTESLFNLSFGAGFRF